MTPVAISWVRLARKARAWKVAEKGAQAIEKSAPSIKLRTRFVLVNLADSLG
jgi:hypothetical protein